MVWGANDPEDMMTPGDYLKRRYERDCGEPYEALEARVRARHPEFYALFGAEEKTRYPFPRNQRCTTSAPWYEWIGAVLFGQKFEDWSGPWHLKTYWWRGRLYLWKYGLR
jgi:hypothetical protein